MKRILLVLPTATYRARDFITAARAAEAEILVASEKPQPAGDTLNYRFVQIDLKRPEWSAAAITEDIGRIDAVLPVDDQGVMVAALAADRLGLAHNPPPAVAATRNKAAMRRLLADAGVPQPEFVVTDLAGAAAAATALGYPAVIKPVSLSASRGVIRVDDDLSAETAAKRIGNILEDAGHSRTDAVLVERYLPGDEVAVEAMLAAGELRVLAILDKPDPLTGPFFEETIFVTPSRHPEALQRRIIETTRAATRALGLVEGPIHAELRVGEESVWVLEIAARPIGGLCSRALSFGLLGASLETVLVRNALRLPQAGLDPQAPAAGAMMLPISSRGRRGEVRNLARALAVPGVTGIEITVPPGEVVIPLPEGDRYLGFIFSRALTPAEAEAALRRAASILEVDIVEVA